MNDFDPIWLLYLAGFFILLFIASCIHYARRQSKRERDAFMPRIQTPSQTDVTALQRKTAKFDPSDDRDLPMLLKRQAD